MSSGHVDLNTQGIHELSSHRGTEGHNMSRLCKDGLQKYTHIHMYIYIYSSPKSIS